MPDPSVIRQSFVDDPKGTVAAILDLIAVVCGEPSMLAHDVSFVEVFARMLDIPPDIAKDYINDWWFTRFLNGE